ncbi:suppressor of disruption of TFIIS-like [Olea europaea subsp. europaea]|uniref:Suppressor of disruption of TFIIS-like n=1 Tax=Olea europaea subsp. europaea TaxID=158383 RepID=A0A8S0QEH0_OLEEU|nr:suppressor of disruption of TFIIS-like [Olea europaea subsp. europaea]
MDASISPPPLFAFLDHCIEKLQSAVSLFLFLFPRSLGSLLCLSSFEFRYLPKIKMEYEHHRYGPYGQVQRSKYDCLLFDLDDTLYPLSAGLATAVLKNIQDYMVEKLGIEESKINDLCNLLYKNYGTTMAGLRAIGYDFDYDEYHSFVHGRLPYENLKPDPVLRSHLSSLPIRKVIFTNADEVHAIKALQKLGLEDCFEGIICFETLNPTHKGTVSDDEDDIEFLGSTQLSRPLSTSRKIFDIIGHFSQPNAESTGLPKTPIVCKPSESAIEKALKIANIDPHRTLFFEDSVRNIQAGKRIGLDTVLVGKSQRIKGADYAFESIHNLKEALPELWETDKVAEVNYSGVAVETSVTA